MDIAPVVERNADFFLKFGGAIALLWAFLRWLMLPMVKAGLRELLQEELKEMRKLADRIGQSDGRYGVLSRDLYDVEQDVEILYALVKENRELVADVITAVDNTIGIERRKQGDLTRLPDMELRIPKKPHRFLADEAHARADDARKYPPTEK